MTEYVEVARGESERGEILLRRRIEDHAADALELRVNGVFVMDTRETGTEVELAAVALDLVEDPRNVVVAGLGLGFTTQRVLADKRVHIVAADIVMAVAEATSTYDLVLLDVDNGPGQLVHGENARLYEADFLASTRQLLNRGGAVVVWSANPAPELRETMEHVFGNCTEQRHGVLLQGRDEEYLLYLSRRS